MSSLKIIVPENFKEFGEKVNVHLNEIRGTNENYVTQLDLIRFNNGEKDSANCNFRDYTR